MGQPDLLLIRERNIDGCGGFADVLLRLREPLGPVQRVELLTELERLKRTMACPDTDAVVGTAIRSVLGDGAEQSDYELLEY